MPQAEHQPGEDARAAGGVEETLRRLEARLERASSAAERLVSEAAAQAGARVGEVKIPPAGWQKRDSGQTDPRPDELEPLFVVLESLRELVPPELRRRLTDALTELLVALRALIDWYLERLERDGAEPVPVEDIPVL